MAVTMGGQWQDAALRKPADGQRIEFEDLRGHSHDGVFEEGEFWLKTDLGLGRWEYGVSRWRARGGGD